MSFSSRCSARKRQSAVSLCRAGASAYLSSSVSGVRCWEEPPPAAPPAGRAACTATRTGLRMPARASSATASVCVAEKSPVRRCLGRYFMMACSWRSKPISRQRSASSNTSSSNERKLRDGRRRKMSARRPGVPMSTLAPLCAARARSPSASPPTAPPPAAAFRARTSASTSVPPTSSAERNGALGSAAASSSGCATRAICVASSRVGDTTSAPTSKGRSGVSRRVSISTIGTTKASVLPEPVVASTATSL
mmetsp:Transcript_11902/g.50108  ORF Transcript_11902/g.50108 Transcript_11902/m.50108 type:complete len:251 (+) Transcript_11902:1366-2118(+)